jgi:hypothetical protein
MKILILDDEQCANTGPGNTKEADPKLFDAQIIGLPGHELVNFVRVMQALGVANERIGEALLEGMSKVLPVGRDGALTLESLRDALIRNVGGIRTSLQQVLG